MRPAYEAVAPADLLEAGGADAQLLAGLIDGHVEVLAQHAHVRVAFRFGLQAGIAA